MSLEKWVRKRRAISLEEGAEDEKGNEFRERSEENERQ